MMARADGTLAGIGNQGLMVVVRWCALVALGGLLVFAAIAKMMTGLGSEILIALIELSIVLVLVVLRRSALPWIGLACLFGAFFGYTFSRWSSGAASCGCFGNIVVRPEVTMWIDIAGIAIASVMSVMHAGRVSMLGVLLSGSLCCAGAGMVVSTVASPPPPSHYYSDEEAQLLLSERYSMLASQEGPAWYVYLYDPDCPLCRVHLPRMRRLEAATESNGDFRVLTIDIFALDAQTGISYWSWGTTPIMLEIARGRIVTRQQSHDFLDPDEVSARYTTTGALRDPLVLVEALDEFAIVRDSATESWLVLILSNRLCDTARAQVSMFRSKVGRNKTLGLLVFEAEELEAQGVPQADWGAWCTAVLYRDGERIAQYTDADIPDPITLWTQLQAGLLLPAE